MSTFTTLKANIRADLDDAAIKSYTATDINDSVQDTYDDIVSLSHCIVKKVTLNWTANLSYYDFPTLVSDFMAVVAIFNNVNNRWLHDDKSILDFDMMRNDWEVATGTPQNWAALNYKHTAVFPRYVSAAGTYDLYYWAKAPTVVDAAAPLIATDFQRLITNGSIADLLESYEEFSKAGIFWNEYVKDLEAFAERIRDQAKTDLLILI